jgi:hypothetical protein
MCIVLQVVKLQDLSVKQKQRMYLRFTKELFILHQLQHERIVPAYACASTLDEVTLVIKVLQLDVKHFTMIRSVSECSYIYAE